MATAETAPAKKGRAKKGEGPYTVSFVDKDNKEFPRVPASVSQIKIAEKDGKAKTFSLVSLKPEIVQQLAADGLKRRLDAFMRNGIGGDKSAVDLADEAYGQIMAGKLYQKAEGKGPGRTFDADLWVSVIEKTAELKNARDPKKHKKASKQNLADFKAKLDAMTAQDRNAKIAQWKKDPVFSLAHKQVVADRAAKDLKVSEVDATADLF